MVRPLLRGLRRDHALTRDPANYGVNGEAAIERIETLAGFDLTADIVYV